MRTVFLSQAVDTDNILTLCFPFPNQRPIYSISSSHVRQLFNIFHVRQLFLFCHPPTYHRLPYHGKGGT